tara:strand:+ start:834 stop:1019 length:186 start_codon:yes stop_codon:yes gene_type:complete
MEKRTLYVKKVTNEELSKKWGFTSYFKGDIYIQSNKAGIVRWASALVYTAKELVARKCIIV